MTRSKLDQKLLARSCVTKVGGGNLLGESHSFVISLTRERIWIDARMVDPSYHAMQVWYAGSIMAGIQRTRL